MSGRLPDWEQRLDALVAARMHTPFAWGEHDCCLWAADAVQAVTGDDPAHGLRGSYADKRGALRVLGPLGGLPGAAARGGRQLPEPRFAQAGDIGMVHDGVRHVLGVCTAGLWLVAGGAGLAVVDFGAAGMAWRVGDA